MCALVNFPSWGVPSVIAVARVLIFIDGVWNLSPNGWEKINTPKRVHESLGRALRDDAGKWGGGDVIDKDENPSNGDDAWNSP